MNVLIGYFSVRAGALSLYYRSDGPIRYPEMPGRAME